MFSKAEVSAGNTDCLLDILKRYNLSQGLDDDSNIFDSTKDMFETIDNIPHGDASWHSIFFRYTGPIDANSPAWKTAQYELIARDTRVVVTNMLRNKDFDGKFDYVPFKEYTAPHNVRYQNGMSGQWAYKIAVRISLNYRFCRDNNKFI